MSLQAITQIVFEKFCFMYINACISCIYIRINNVNLSDSPPVLALVAGTFLRSCHVLKLENKLTTARSCFHIQQRDGRLETVSRFRRKPVIIVESAVGLLDGKLHIGHVMYGDSFLY